MTFSDGRHNHYFQGVLLLVIVNVTVLAGLTLISFVTRINGHEVYPAAWLDVPPGTLLLNRPWTPLTYMFTQTDIWHAIFNMLWLYWFGLIYQNLTTPRKTVGLYIASGLAGAAVYIIGSIVWPRTGGAGLEGASAAVMGVVTATACMVPDFKIRLFILGPVKIKWIAIVTIAIFAIGLSGNNAGAHLAHFGGVAMGATLVLIPRFKSRSHRTVATPNGLSDADARALLDSLLDKVRRSGYGSLSREERRQLVELSKKV